MVMLSLYNDMKENIEYKLPPFTKVGKTDNI